MKLVDILARELKVWPEGVDSVWQSSCDNEIYFDTDVPPFYTSLNAEDSGTQGAVITQAQWQAAVDALNADKCEHSYANNIGCPECIELNAPKVVEWDGVGDPPVGTVCEYDARPSGKGEPLFVTVEVKYVSDQSIVIICTDVPDGEKKENIGVELALMNGLAMRGKLRPIRTAEQVAAEERKSEILEMIDTFGTDTAIWGRDAVMEICGHLWESGYRKEPKPCGS